MISATRNKVKWERERGRGGLLPLSWGIVGFILFYFWGWLCCCVLKKQKGGFITMAVKAWFKLR
jgi:hypothetical protein